MPSTSVSTKHKRYQCRVCKNAFRRREHLTRHVRRHTLERPYQCTLCKLQFSRKETHDRHQRVQHQIDRDAVLLPQIVGPLGQPDWQSIIPPSQAGRQPGSSDASTDVDSTAPVSVGGVSNGSPPQVVEAGHTDSQVIRVQLPVVSGTWFSPPRELPTPEATVRSLLAPPSEDQLLVINHMRNLMLEEVVSRGIYLEPDFPSCITLDTYQKMFFTAPGRNLPFIHDSASIVENAPAVNLALLAAGAAYCGNWNESMRLFEASRRLVSCHLETHGSQKIPLWILDTLTMNTVFGLPGGEDPSPKIIQGHLRTVFWLALRIDPPTTWPAEHGLLTVDEEWQLFIRHEGYKRSLWCMFIAVGLWSVAFLPFPACEPIKHFALDLPYTESLWLAPSAQQWKTLSLTTNKPPKLATAIKDLSLGNQYPCDGLASLCLLAGILLRQQKISMASKNICDEDLRMALSMWQLSYNASNPENSAINVIAFPALAYIYTSLEVSCVDIIALLCECRFGEMRKILRSGGLREAGQHACRAIMPWADYQRNRTSMVFFPCAIVAFEAFILLHEEKESDVSAQGVLDMLYDTLGLSSVYVGLSSLWLVLQKRIFSGPVTRSLLNTLTAYSKYISDTTSFPEHELVMLAHEPLSAWELALTPS